MLETRRPTGKPAWPITLIAGMQGSGKSWIGAEASASPLIAKTYWVGFGELDPDEYGAIPGADFDIVTHDGTVRGVVSVLDEIASLPPWEDGETLIVFDSASRYWDTLTENAQHRANTRAASGRERGAAPITSADIGVDIWNLVKGDWQDMLGALRRHRGPSIITARFEEVSTHANGKPTGDKHWRVKAEKGLPYDIDVVVEMQARGDSTITKVRSSVLQLQGPMPTPHFTMDELWRMLGLADGNAGTRVYADPVPEATAPAAPRDWLAEIAEATTLEQLANIRTDAIVGRADRAVLGAISTRRTALTTTPPGGKK